MKINKIALQISVFVLIVSSFIACDKDFATLESDIINQDIATNFDILSLSETNPALTEVITKTEALDPVQTNGVGFSALGLYDDIYGRVSSSFVAQLTLSTYAPTFGDEAVIDSVVLSIPYYGSITDIDEDGNYTFDVDSILPEASSYNPIKLSLYESSYFIRDFDPNAEFNEEQVYYSNKYASSSEMISDASLMSNELSMLMPSPDPVNHVTLDANGNLDINDRGFILTELDDEGETQVTSRQFPGIRLKLDPQFWKEKILDKEGDAVLSNANNFLEYFRGIYFKAEPVNDDGSYLLLNTASTNSNITIYYTRLTPSTTDDPDETEQTSFTLNFGGNRINFLENSFDNESFEDLSEEGSSRVYLKGGEGTIGRILLFNGDNEDDDPEINAFEQFRSEFVVTEDGKFVKSKRLVNEANLVFYVDDNVLNGEEPDRIFLYDIENKTPLVDYFLDGINNALPLFSVSNHLGPLQRVNDDPNENGIKYKLKITEHINNLLVRDSTNVELGLAVSLNVNLEESIGQRKVLTSDNSDFTVPVSSVLTPRGTVLHGSNTEDESKKVYLEIYYTEPNN
ncbi:DUF4270 domain-containing protein [Winogradskyella pulchriflava]|uniref:DUF4270 domain-containing protein n=1 Tax=Winogradskyella pulchriflava TaxID=1110688 RepID=A0ABV6Q7J9_9FLAO